MKSAPVFVLLLGLTAPAVAQTKPEEVVRCAPDSVVGQLRGLMQELQFDDDSSYVTFVPDSVSSGLGSKAQILRDLPTCKRAHAAFLRDALESDPGPVDVGRVGSFYFIWEGDSQLVVVDRHWKYVALLGWGL